MSKLAHSNDSTMQEIEQRALFQRDESGYRMSDSECFQALFDGDIEEIKWDAALNTDYMNWIYFNIK